MDSFVFDLASKADDRLREVDILIARAQQEPPGSDLFNALCRSAIVLIVAHLEGFVKDCVKAVIDDINAFDRFRNIPKEMKYTFCRSFLGKENDKTDAQRLIRLAATFDTLDTKLTHLPFWFDDNKNPSPTVVDRVCRNFGVEHFFATIDASLLDAVFKGAPASIDKLKRLLKQYVLHRVRTYPYTTSIRRFGLGPKKSPGQKTLWETFLDQLLKTRHDIAHGTSLVNGCSVEDVFQYRDKVYVLQFTFILVLCSFVGSATVASGPSSP